MFSVTVFQEEGVSVEGPPPACQWMYLLQMSKFEQVWVGFPNIDSQIN